MGLMIFVVFGCLQVLFSLYFWKISKEWIYLAYFALIFNIISFFGTIFFIPDTPRFFYSIKNYAKAREIMDNIRKRNGKSSKYYTFDTEADLLEQ